MLLRDRNTKILNLNLHTFLDNFICSKVATMLGTTLDKEEVEEFMREADVVIYRILKKKISDLIIFFQGWKW